VNDHDEHQKGDLDLAASRQEDPYLAKLEDDKKLEAWKQQQEQRREEERIKKQKAELEAYLSPRRQRWVETTGAPQPPPDVVSRWTQEFIDEKEFAKEAKRLESMAEAYAAFPWGRSLD
jgi:hypothetical protein